MNWFERYGIPGAYFIILSLCWLFALYDISIENLSKYSTSIGVIVIISFVPIGYILSALAQSLYLLVPIFGIHRKAWRKSGTLNCIQNANSLFLESDYEVLSHFQIIYKSKGKENSKNIDAIEKSWKWCSKRFDMLAMDSAIIIATFISNIIPIILYFPSKCNDWTLFQWEAKLWAIILIKAASFCIVIILSVNYLLLSRQLVEITKQQLVYYFKNGGKNNCQKTTGN